MARWFFGPIFRVVFEGSFSTLLALKKEFLREFECPHVKQLARLSLHCREDL